MKKFNVNELKSECTIAHKRGQESEPQHSGWNNGHIYKFYRLEFENDNDMQGHFSESNIVFLTKNELNDWYIID